MKQILIFSGTTEGRELAQRLQENQLPCHVSVATEYGSLVMPELPNVKLHEGRLDQEQMVELMERENIQIVVDATHPYAALVTETIQAAAQVANTTYLRLLRPNDVSSGTTFASPEDCAEALRQTEGPILLTTGSKDLKVFCQDLELRQRLVVRVLPGMESLQLCYEQGLEGKQIIAMQGPFSKEMNASIMKQYQIRHMVTKESGRIGGVDTKMEAAQDLGVEIHVIARPDSPQVEGYTMTEILAILGQEYEVSWLPKWNITLAGIGCGAEASITKEVETAIQQATVLFGAPRMLDGVFGSGMKFPCYRPEEILPKLKEMQKDGRNHQIVILYSGDVGFYSGAKRMLAALQDFQTEMEGKLQVECNLLPGISSIPYFAAKLGIPWQDAALLSLHGDAPEAWMPKLQDRVEHHALTMCLTSGLKDVKRFAEILKHPCTIDLGYRLSYPEERILHITPQECSMLQEDGLYVAAIHNPAAKGRLLAPQLSDDAMLRGNVPMTKSDVRKLSVCRLGLREGDVVYDIGAGTGSISMELGLLSSTLQVYAIEYRPEALEMIQKNKEKFHLSNVSVVSAMAPEGLQELPVPAAAFIGGSKGNLREILKTLYGMNPSMHIVMNAVSLESIQEMQTLCQTLPVTNVEISQISVSQVKTIGNYHMLQGNNPVWIFAFSFQPVTEEDAWERDL